MDVKSGVGFGVATGAGIETAVAVLRGERMSACGADELRVMAALQPHIASATAAELSPMTSQAEEPSSIRSPATGV